MARGELAHNINTPELSQIAKKVLVTILRRLNGRALHRLTNRVGSSNLDHSSSAADNSRRGSTADDNNKADSSTRCNRVERSWGQNYKKETGMEVEFRNLRLGLGPGVERGPRRK